MLRKNICTRFSISTSDKSLGRPRLFLKSTTAARSSQSTTQSTQKGIHKQVETTKSNKSDDKSMESTHDLSSQTFYHGTKANLTQGDLIEPGFNSNYGKQKKAKYIYLTATLGAATWGAELALGEGRERIYIVEPTGPIEDDPNLTDRKYPGNPTKSYRSLHPLRVSDEVMDWQGHSPEELKTMKEHIERLNQLGIEAED